jgi:putative endonuclease
VSAARQALGRLGERLAAEHLERLGYRIVVRNHRTRHGELDLVACDDERLLFVEVKARRSGPGRPLEKIDWRKRGQVRLIARSWLAETPDRPHRREVRFDAIGVTVDAAGRLIELEHLEAAF